MKSIKKTLMLVAFVLVATNGLMAQDFKTSIGARLGSPFGGSFRQYFTQNISGELIGGLKFIDGTAFMATLLGAYHIPIGDTNFDFYLNAGPSVGIGSELLIGATLGLGLEYRFEGQPFAISIDMLPTVGPLRTYGYSAVTLRYELQ